MSPFLNDESQNLQTKGQTPDPVELCRDIPNFAVVNERLYRGGQPEPGDFAKLKELGVHTVINLREDPGQHSEEETAVRAAGLNYVGLHMNPFFKPKAEEIKQFLATVTNAANQPVYLHCLHGQDRTGMCVGIYRMVVEGADFKTAFDEMCALGFHKEFIFLTETAKEYEGKTLEEVLSK